MPANRGMTKTCWMLAAGLALVAAGCSNTQNGLTAEKPPAPPALRMGVIPYDKPEAIQEQYQQFGDYIARKLGAPSATVSVASDYVGVITALENDQIDVAYLNPLSYAIAQDRAQKNGHALPAIAMPYVITKGQNKGSLTYEGVIFVRADSGIKSLKDLKGKTVAFNEQTSTSGYLYPAAMFLKIGINPKPKSEGGDLKDALFAGATGVVPAVFNKQVDAGAIFDEGIQLSLPNPADQAQIKVIAKTDPIPNGMLVARADLPPDQVAKLKAALQTINTEPAGKKALAEMRVEKWAPADDSLFDPVRKTATVLGLGLESLDKKKG